MKTENIQIAFVHKGESWYLPYVLKQAIKYNPNQVVFINDSDDKYNYHGLSNVSISSLETPLSLEFRKTYKHFSTNPYEYELFLLFTLVPPLEYMNQKN